MKPAVSPSSEFTILNQEVTTCVLCPRLVDYRERIGREKRRAYMDWDYWAKPVPGFGDTSARILILGLAPGAHGSNRTGRPFTGDGSGYFMYPVLHQAGFASQAKATHRDDGLKLTGAYITAAVRCAPPANKPTPEELTNCSRFLDRELKLFTDLRVVVTLGKIAFDAYLRSLKRTGVISNGVAYTFRHAAEYKMPDGRYLLASYHPSMQNTNTGKLTEKMFAEVFKRASVLLKKF